MSNARIKLESYILFDWIDVIFKLRCLSIVCLLLLVHYLRHNIIYSFETL